MTVYNAGDIYLEDLSGGTSDQIHIYAQTDNIADGAVTDAKLASVGLKANALRAGGHVFNVNNEPVSPYDDMNTLPIGEVVTYIGDAYIPANSPVESMTNLLTVVTYNYRVDNRGGCVQIAADSGRFFFRTGRTNAAWTSWVELVTASSLYPIADSALADNGIKENAIRSSNYVVNTAEKLTSPYDDCNTVPYNVVLCYVNYYPANAPAQSFTGNAFSLVTYNYRPQTSTAQPGGAAQIATSKDDVWMRYKSSSNNTSWSSWMSLTKPNANDAYSSIPALSTFDNVGVIGDSWSAGSVYTDQSTYTNVDSLRWAVIAAKKYGFTPAIFASPGASTKTWLTRTNGLAAMQAADQQDLYVCCLGINDDAQGLEIGTAADIDDDTKENFYASYGKIVRAIVAKAPNAKIALALVPRYNESADVTAYNTAIRAVAQHFSIGLLDTDKDEFFTSAAFDSDRQYNHLTAVGYTAMAEAINRMLSENYVANRNYWRYSMM